MASTKLAREAKQRYQLLDKPRQRLIDGKLSDLSDRILQNPIPSEIGHLLTEQHHSWDRRTYGISFSTFEELLFDQLRTSKFEWGRARLKDFKTFWRIFGEHFGVSPDTLAKVKPEATPALNKLYPKRIYPQQPVDAELFLEDPVRVLELLIAGQTTYKVVEDYADGKIDALRVDFPGRESEIEDYLWNRRGQLSSAHNIEIVDRQVRFRYSGTVDFVGHIGNQLAVIEVKEPAEAPSVGQTLAYMNELQEALKFQNSEVICSSKMDVFGNLVWSQSWDQVVIGWIVAESFRDSLYYACQGQDLQLHRAYKSSKVLHGPLDCKQMNREEWDQFVGPKPLQ